MQDFSSLGLPQPLMNSLEKIEFTTPTPIQAKSIPHILEGKDILGSAQTGTGKTGAFGIPLVAKLLSNPRGKALILTPTRELAMQVEEMLNSFLGKYSPVKSVLLIGGESMPAQLKQLQARPRLIVGTPGRINDHLERGSLMLHDANFLVLDETDRMLDMGFGVQIERILKFLPQQRQTLLFSATLPDNIVSLSKKYLTDPVRVSVGSITAPIAKIKQEVVHIEHAKKYDALINQLKEREGSILVFVKTKYGAEKMATRLRRGKHSAEAIHGDLRQNKRERVINTFRDCKFRILVATDIAARGLDIPHIEHVINYDLPQAPEDFIHRVGRTGRAGAEGSTICFVAKEDALKWRAIQNLLNPGQKQESTSPRDGSPRPGGNKNRRNRFRGQKGKPEQGAKDSKRSGNFKRKRPNKSRPQNRAA